MQAIEFDTIIKDGIIRIPSSYRKDITDKVRVIILKEKEHSKPLTKDNEMDAFFEAAGVWKDRTDITMNELRNKGWEKREVK